MTTGYSYTAGAQTYTCLGCGAVVEEQYRPLHDRWHERVDLLTESLDDLVAQVYRPEEPR